MYLRYFVFQHLNTSLIVNPLYFLYFPEGFKTVSKLYIKYVQN